MTFSSLHISSALSIYAFSFSARYCNMRLDWGYRFWSILYFIGRTVFCEVNCLICYVEQHQAIGVPNNFKYVYIYARMCLFALYGFGLNISNYELNLLWSCRCIIKLVRFKICRGLSVILKHGYKG